MTNMVYVVYCDEVSEPTAVFNDRDDALALCDALESNSSYLYWVDDMPILNSTEEYKNV